MVAHWRVETAIWASCSGVVPYSAMCRVAAIAYAPMGIRIPDGISHSAWGLGPPIIMGLRPGPPMPPPRARSPRGVDA